MMDDKSGRVAASGFDPAREMAPDMYGFRDLPDDPKDTLALWHEMGEIMREHGATWFRMTIVSDDYPMPPYPHGLYMEGWRVDPARMDPPARSAPFNYPLVAQNTEPST